MRRRLLGGVAAATALAIALPSAPAHAADDKQQCVEGYEQSQHLRRDGKLRAAHERLVVCSNRACPQATQLDCTRWLAEVEQAQPTIVVSAKGPGGQEIAGVRVLVDGEVAAERLDGRAIDVDPGLRRVRAESADGRVLEQNVLFREGEKLRAIEFSFPPASPPPAAAPVVVGGPGPKPSREPGGWSPPLASYLLGGAGLAAVVVGTYLDVSGKDQETNLKDTCAPNCSHSSVEAMRTRVLAGDIVLGAGVASVASAVVIAIVSPRSGARAAWVSPLPVAAGAAVVAGASF
jgi:hypothetical protein